MTYVLKNLPEDVEKALEQRAQTSHQTVDVVIEELLVDIVRSEKTVATPDERSGVEGPTKKRDLSEFAGSWVEDPAFDEAIAAQRQIDPDAWK